jgi:hypothetical protein
VIIDDCRPAVSRDDTLLGCACRRPKDPCSMVTWPETRLTVPTVKKQGAGRLTLPAHRSQAEA